MPIEVINVGAMPDDGTGDLYRVAMQKVNASLAYLDIAKANASDVAIALGGKVDKVAGSRLITTTEANKLAGIASGATANATDAQLRDRSTHTGTQAISTISGLQTALDAKAPIASPAFTGSPTAPTPAVGTNTTQLQTTAGALAQMQAFGLGANRCPDIADLNAQPVAGFYLATPAVSLSAGLPLNIAHSIVQGAGSSGSGWQIALPISSNPAVHGRSWHRQINGGVWTSWFEYAKTESPSFTGTPSTPNLKFGNAASSDVNTLDYYEEGTFTPTIAGSTTAGTPTYATQSGRHTRVGNRVLYSLLIAISAKGGMVGNLTISGLPFIVASRVEARGAATIGRAENMTLSTPTPLTATHSHGVAIVIPYKQTATGSASQLAATDISDTFTLYISGQYEV